MKGRVRIILLLSGLVLAAAADSPAVAQVFRMEGTTGATAPSWSIDPPRVTCTHDDGFLRWASHTTSWYVNTTGQSDATAKQNAIQNALAAWTSVTDADFVLNYGGTTAAGFQVADGINSLSWGTDAACTANSCHALTALRLVSGRQIVESDILFNSSPTQSFQWKTDGTYSPSCWVTAGTSGLMLDTQGIATHELGHALGIHHPTNHTTTSATMGRKACIYDARTLENDDILALRCSEDRYPENPNYQGLQNAPTCQAITGWAWNANQGYERSYVEIVEDLGSGNVDILGLAHADLTGAPVGDGRHAFSFSLDLRDGNWHQVRARFSGNQTNVGSNYPLICDKFLFPLSSTPSDLPLSTGGNSYEVGTQFKSDVPGKITQLGYYFAPGEPQAPSHTIKLWTDGGTSLVTKSISPVSGKSGWSYVTLNPSIPIAANTNYRVSVDTYLYQSKSSCGSPGSLQGGYYNSPLTAIQGFWSTGAGPMPTTPSCSNFFVGVRFDM